jgi:uncharacterized NAD(P)/FAD-binding protein YdhS
MAKEQLAAAAYAVTSVHFRGGRSIRRSSIRSNAYGYLRERHLSHRLLDDYDAIVDACCHAWNQLTPQRISSLCNYPYIQQVSG